MLHFRGIHKFMKFRRQCLVGPRQVWNLEEERKNVEGSVGDLRERLFRHKVQTRPEFYYPRELPTRWKMVPFESNRGITGGD